MQRETWPKPSSRATDRHRRPLWGPFPPAYLVWDIQAAAGFTEGHHNRHVAVFAGHVQRGVAMPVLEIDETSLAEESLDDLHLTSSHSKMKSNVSVLQQTPGPWALSLARGPGHLPFLPPLSQAYLAKIAPAKSEEGLENPNFIPVGWRRGFSHSTLTNHRLKWPSVWFI